MGEFRMPLWLAVLCISGIIAGNNLFCFWVGSVWEKKRKTSGEGYASKI